MSDYIDNVVLSLKRQYKKDELVAYLVKKEKELEQLVVRLNAERDEVVEENNAIKKLTPEDKANFKKGILYEHLRREIKDMREKCRKLEITNERLTHELTIMRTKK